MKIQTNPVPGIKIEVPVRMKDGYDGDEMNRKIAGLVASKDAVTVRRFERLDFVADGLPKPKQTADGFWQVSGRVARCGVQEYRRADGSVLRELRLPEDVKASVPGFALMPLTNNHPPGMVTPENAKQYVAGAVGEAEYADGWVTAPMTIYSADAIEAVKAGRAELSVGYQCKLVDESGEWNGQKYDCRQADIVVNHVALVDVARAGHEARLRLDAGDAATNDVRVFQVPNNPVLASQSHGGVQSMPHKMKLDGLDIEVADANSQAIIERAIENARKAGSEKIAAETSRADAADKARADAEKALADMTAKFDALDGKVKADAERMMKCDECDGSGKIGESKCDGCGGEGEVKADSLFDDGKRKASLGRCIHRKAAALAKLHADARRVLGKNAKLDGKTEREIKSEVIGKLAPKYKLDGKSDAHVDGAFESFMSQLPDEPAAIDRARMVQDPVPAKIADAEPAQDPGEAKARMTAKLLSMSAKK